MSLKWLPEYSVNVKEIDNQHKQFIQLICRLFKAIDERTTQKELGPILNELITFAKNHFQTEEKYFDKFNYENSKSHKNEHRKFKKKVSELKNKYQNNEIEISYELVDFLEDWLVEHLMKQDQKYVQCFAENGLV